MGTEAASGVDLFAAPRAFQHGRALFSTVARACPSRITALDNGKSIMHAGMPISNRLIVATFRTDHHFDLGVSSKLF